MTNRYRVTVGPRGRVVIPAELRKQLQIDEGDTLIFTFEQPGVVTMRTEQAVIDRIRSGIPRTQKDMNE